MDGTVKDVDSTTDLNNLRQSGVPIVLYFWASLCDASKHIDLVFHHFANDFPNVHFLRVEAEKHPEIAGFCSVKVEAVPYFVFFKDGKLVDTFEGSDSSNLLNKVRKFAEPASSSTIGSNDSQVEAGKGGILSPGSPCLNETLQARLEGLVNSEPVMLFMMGEPEERKCQFSAKVVDILKQEQIKFGSFNICLDDEVCQGLKVYSNCSSYPQLYVSGELMGGLDRVLEMQKSGELKNVLSEKGIIGKQSPEDRWKALINSSEVILFMKGSPDVPRCRFSSKIVKALRAEKLDFKSFDILTDEETRQGIENFSICRTFPQLYYKGVLIRGHDLFLELSNGLRVNTGLFRPSNQDVISQDIVDIPHFTGTYHKLDGKNTSDQDIPPQLREVLQFITEREPDGNMIYYLAALKNFYAIWSKNETMPEKLHDSDWYNSEIPVQDQGRHSTCWSTAGAENIGEVRKIHSIDVEYRPLSAQYLQDVVAPAKAESKFKISKGKHRCYGHSSFRGFEYAMKNGIPARNHWRLGGCDGQPKFDGRLHGARVRHVLNDVKCSTSINKALDYLKIQPILGSLAIFNPDFRNIKQGIYRGPASEYSYFLAWHAVSIRRITVEDGETIALIKNSHGTKQGDFGYVKVSMDVMLCDLTPPQKAHFGPLPHRFPHKLFRSFTFGEVRKEYEKEVVEWYLNTKMENELAICARPTSELILEAIYQNTSGYVSEYQDGMEIIGTPTDRALFKWALELKSTTGVTFTKDNTSILKGNHTNSNYKGVGVVVYNQQKKNKKVRIHWKGNAAYILDKCTMYELNGQSLHMSATKKSELEEAIKEMRARKLISIAVAFRGIKKDIIPHWPQEKENWVIPCSDLTLLCIFGIKDPCFNEDTDEQQACLDFEDENRIEKNFLFDVDNEDEDEDEDKAVCTAGAMNNSEEKPNFDQIVNQREAASNNIFKHKEFNLKSLGIGGLGAGFSDIFRRAFASLHVTSRSGRLDVQVEISLPDENGHLQILQIHTNKFKEHSFLGADINLHELAARTKNYSGAELEGVIKCATSYAFNRQLSMDDLTKPVEEENIKITMEDFLHAIHEVQPAFGVSTDDLERCRLNGMVDSGDRHNHIYKRAMLLVEQVKVSTRSPLVTCFLEGPSGSGKTALAATVGIDSDFPYVKIVSAETMIGLSESTKCAHIVKVFEDAYKSPMSIIILDDIERLLEYVPIGPRFSNIISQTMMVLLKRLPPKGKKLLVFGTTSELTFLDSVGICGTFSVPTLKMEDAKKVLKLLNVFSEDDVDAAADAALCDMPIKKLLIEMAAQGEHGESAEAVYSGREKIKITHFFDCLQDIVRF